MSHPDPLPDGHWRVDLGGIDVRFGEGQIDALGEAAAAFGVRRVLLVTDPGIEDAGHVGRALRALGGHGIDAMVFDGVEENPTTDSVARGVVAAAKARAELLIGIGGGSAMDCTKGINFIHSRGGRMADHWGDGKGSGPMLPSIGVPTTAGTGSDAQRFALISDAQTHVKMACGDRQARFKTVILDPSLVSSMPRSVAAVTAMDALSHAVESYVTRHRNPISQLFAREAWRLLEGSFETFLEHPDDRDARGRMLLGSHLAGASIETSMLGAAHACANPLTARFGITHGAAVGLMLPHIVRFNGGTVEHLYHELTEEARLNGHHGADTPSSADRLGARIVELRTRAALPASLRDCGVPDDVLDTLADEAAGQWTAQHNPRAVDAGDLKRLYEAAL